MVIKKGVPSIFAGKWALAALVLLLASGVHTAWAATTFLVIAPGQSYTAGNTPNRYNPVTQVAGEVFYTSVYCFNNSTNNPVNSNGATTGMSSSSPSSTFVPSSPALTLPVGGTTNCYQSVTTTLFPATTNDYTLAAAANGGAGISGDSTTIHVQSISQFQFVIGSFTAGTAGTLTINALDSGSALCDHYNSATGVHLFALDAGANGGTVDLGLITFVNGVYTGSIPLFHATNFARFQAVKAGAPAVTTTSSTFVISPEGSSHWLVIGPGQSISSGTTSGNGRSGGSSTTNSQTAGNNFSMTMYVCDAYWNTKTSAAVGTLASSDGTYSNTVNMGGGSSLTLANVNLHTVGTGTQIMTISGGGPGSQTDNVPLTNAALDHFSISTIGDIAVTTATTPLQVTAYDQFGNTVTSVGGTTTLSVLQLAVPLKTGVSTYGVLPNTQTLTFTSGVFNGSLFVRKVGFNYSVNVTNGAVVSSSTGVFGVLAAGAANRYIVCMPGETLTPGELNVTTWGRIGAGANVTAGVPVNVSVLVTDQYGNKVTSSQTVSSVLDRTDSGAVFSPVSPFAIPGNNLLSMKLTLAASSPSQQRLTITTTPPGGPTDGNTGFFNVVSNNLDHFAVAALSTQTAGTGFTTNITAMDVYGNPVQSYTNPIYITSPLADYHNPEQSVISVAGGTSGSPTSVTWTVSGGFSNGVWTGTLTVFRATTANIFVSNIADGTGATGTSAAFAVAPANMTKVFLVVPGLTYRPGTGGGTGIQTGGYVGSPDTQQMNAPFGVTIYATDAWWNQVPGINFPFHFFTSDTSSVGVDPGTGFNFTNGILFINNLTFTSGPSYTLTVHSNTGGITDYVTPYSINSIALNHFTLNSLDGLTWDQLPSNVVAGVPFNLSITAYSSADDSAVVIGLNGQANLTSSVDYAEPFRSISPQRITFINGKWGGQVTLYQQVLTQTCGVTCTIGSVHSTGTNSIRVHHNVRKKMLIIAPGMAAKPGISPDTYPPGGFPGYTGNPATHEAGQPFSMDFYLCDQYWNVVTNTAQGGNHIISVTSSDPYPAWMGAPLPVTATLTAVLGYPSGAYLASMKLYTLGSNGYQTVTAHDNNDGTVSDFTLGANGVPAISLYHTKLALVGGLRNTYAFNIQPATAAGHLMAGVPFWCTITAQDQFGNPMDSRNGASPFSASNNVNLGLGSASNTLYPTIVQLPIEGVGSFNLTAYKRYQGVGNSVNAQFTDSDGNHTGWSPSFLVDSNKFARLVPIVNGMTLNEGVYVSQPPSQFLGYSGSPATQIAGTMVNFQVYACDAYCNLTTGAIDFVSVTSSDRYAHNPQHVRLNWNSGFVDFNNISDPFAFHRAAPATITVADDSNGSILNGATPFINVNPASPFGLITLPPGKVLVEGSGNSNIPSGLIGGVSLNGWFAGVTPTAVPNNNTTDVYAGGSEFSGVYFPVTVQAADVYGNRVTSGDAFELRTSTEGNGGATPNVSVPLVGALSGGAGVVSARLLTTGGQVIFPWDTTNVFTMNPAGGDRTDLNITTLGQTHFTIAVNGVATGGPVFVQAAPRTFVVRVEVHDDYNDLIVGSANIGFILEVFTNPANSTPGHGTLLLTNGQTLNGTADLTETYNVAETIYIRVSEVTGSDRPTKRTGPEVRVTAGGPAQIVMSSDAESSGGQYSMHANEVKNVLAQVLDINGNPISGDVVNFTIADSFSSRLWDGANALTATAGTSGATGFATTPFKASGNETARITATSSMDPNVSNFLNIVVSVTQNGGVYPNPFNPSSSDARNWAHIDYRLDQAAPVKVYIYTLFGDLVWHKEISAGGTGAVAGPNTTVWNGKNDNGVTVANGGYIVSVKVNDQQKYRFKLGAFKQK